MKFTEAQLESAIIELLGVESNLHVLGEVIERQPKEILTKLRDTLLPQLICGELRITEAEQLTEEAMK
jgi:hypothetical protein